MEGDGPISPGGGDIGGEAPRHREDENTEGDVHSPGGGETEQGRI